jgi:predicted phage baseplate assembly protein
MEFDFLPNLPKSDLDDRDFKDLMEECLLRIPRYCPEWTNYNPSDPGITLVELFAWLTDQMRLRFNQVPRRNYVAFLELLGIRLQPPQPAHTDLTFYLSQAQPFPIIIPRDTEVATERTAAEEAIVFSTKQDLIIGNPRIRHLLLADRADAPIDSAHLTNLFRNTPIEETSDWERIDETELFRNSQLGSCFYLVLDSLPDTQPQNLQGNVLEITFRGEPATGTGINPDAPPRLWQAWNGSTWEPILRRELDDRTKGFNFDEQAQGSNFRGAGQGQARTLEASLMLHLPQTCPATSFDTQDYHGHWIRCVYEPGDDRRQTYSTSPRVLGMTVRSVGGSVGASQCIRVQEELLGISTGKPGQLFPLQMQPVLERRPTEVIAGEVIAGEVIEVRTPGEPPEIWTEVKDFASSTPSDPHYTIDSRTGMVQFGPVIRTAQRLKQSTHDRSLIQSQLQPRRQFQRSDGFGWNEGRPIADASADGSERQYGKVPPPNAEICMKSYRFGGGQRGNVQPEKLTVVRSSLSYVASVTNYAAAEGGDDAETLEEAVIRVPELLRTRECAVTPAEFEQVVLRSPVGLARAHCLTEARYTSPGTVRLLVVPNANTQQWNWLQGMHPDRVFPLSDYLQDTIQAYVRDRRPLGIQVKLQEPEYMGVSVGLEVSLEPSASNREAIVAQLQIALYQFLNPLTGGLEGRGWPLGRPVYVSDIVSLCQKIPGVRHLGHIQLSEVRKWEDGWSMTEAIGSRVDPGPLGLICSWAGESDGVDPRHRVEIMT